MRHQLCRARSGSEDGCNSHLPGRRRRRRQSSQLASADYAVIAVRTARGPKIAGLAAGRRVVS